MDDDVPMARNRMFIVRACPTRFPGDARYGLVTTKRTFRHAVDRNRARRLLRDWIGHNERLLRPDWDYVFIARTPILDATRADGRDAIRKALRYISRMDIPAPQVTND